MEKDRALGKWGWKWNSEQMKGSGKQGEKEPKYKQLVNKRETGVGTEFRRNHIALMFQILATTVLRPAIITDRSC